MITDNQGVNCPDLNSTKPTFAQQLTATINDHCVENNSNTPDFILATYMLDCLSAFEKASNARETWFGKSLKIGE